MDQGHVIRHKVLIEGDWGTDDRCGESAARAREARHARPYHPQAKDKTERFIRTCCAQLLPTLVDGDTGSLDTLKRSTSCRRTAPSACAVWCTRSMRLLSGRLSRSAAIRPARRAASPSSAAIAWSMSPGPSVPARMASSAPTTAPRTSRPPSRSCRANGSERPGAGRRRYQGSPTPSGRRSDGRGRPRGDRAALRPPPQRGSHAAVPPHHAAGGDEAVWPVPTRRCARPAGPDASASDGPSRGRRNPPPEGPVQPAEPQVPQMPR
jgi:hypothetical protein